MNTPTTASGNSIQDRLQSLQVALRRWFWVTGISRTVLVALGLLVVIGVLDYLFRFDRPQRLFLLVLLGAFLVYRIVRDILRPLQYLPDADTLCAQVDAQHPEVKETIIAALQLGRYDDPRRQGFSPALVSDVVAEGRRAAESIDFQSILNRAGRNRLLGLCGLALGTLLFLGAFTPTTTATWLNRCLFAGSSRWPQRTQLRFVEGITPDSQVVLVGRGEPLPVGIEVVEGSVIPSSVLLMARYADGTVVHSPATQSGERQFRATVPDVTETMEIQARGGDGDTPWITLRPVSRPRIESLEITLRVPEYTRMPPQTLAADRDYYDVLVGSRIELRLAANTPLAKVKLTDRANQPLPNVTIDPADPRVFTTTLDIHDLTEQLIRVSLESSDGLGSLENPELRFRPYPDRAPIVRSELEGVGSMVVAGAILPVRYQIRDDFGISQAALVVEPQLPEEGTAPTQRQSLNTSSALVGRLEAGETEGKTELATFDLAGRELPVGTVLSLQVEARDNDVHANPPYKTALSPALSVRIVEETVLRSELLRREVELRKEMEEVIAAQGQLRTHVERIGQSWRADTGQEGLNEIAGEVGDIARAQRGLGGRCGSIASRYQAILLEMLNNRFENRDSANYERVNDSIVLPLRELAGAKIPQAASLAESILKSPPPAVAEAITLLHAEQNAIHERLTRILGRMNEVGYRESLVLYRKMVDAQIEVSRKTKEAADQAIEGIFDE